jgi:hypothetical protein
MIQSFIDTYSWVHASSLNGAHTRVKIVNVVHTITDIGLAACQSTAVVLSSLVLCKYNVLPCLTIVRNAPFSAVIIGVLSHVVSKMSKDLYEKTIDNCLQGVLSPNNIESPIGKRAAKIGVVLLKRAVNIALATVLVVLVTAVASAALPTIFPPISTLTCVTFAAIDNLKPFVSNIDKSFFKHMYIEIGFRQLYENNAPLKFNEFFHLKDLFKLGGFFKLTGFIDLAKDLKRT